LRGLANGSIPITVTKPAPVLSSKNIIDLVGDVFKAATGWHEVATKLGGADCPESRRVRRDLDLEFHLSQVTIRGGGNGRGEDQQLRLRAVTEKTSGVWATEADLRADAGTVLMLSDAGNA